MNQYCQPCDCTGIRCQSQFPGLRVEWPELKGVSGPEAKRKIESDNPHVTGVLYAANSAIIQNVCCNRVWLRVPSENYPNGPVLNVPKIG